jgi:uncharacterized protein DUF3224
VNLVSEPAHAHCPFEVQSFAPGDPWGSADTGGPSLGRATLRKDFSGGDLEGGSTVEMLTARAGERAATYLALEQIHGSLAGRTGGFVLAHGATAFADGRPDEHWAEVVDGSGTGELVGLAGRGRVTHGLLELDYELPD